MINWENLGTAVIGNTIPYSSKRASYEQKVVTVLKN